MAISEVGQWTISNIDQMKIHCVQGVYYTNFPYPDPEQYKQSIENNEPWANIVFWPAEGRPQFFDAMWAREFSLTWNFSKCASRFTCHSGCCVGSSVCLLHYSQNKDPCFLAPLLVVEMVCEVQPLPVCTLEGRAGSQCLELAADPGSRRQQHVINWRLIPDAQFPLHLMPSLRALDRSEVLRDHSIFEPARRRHKRRRRWLLSLWRR